MAHFLFYLVPNSHSTWHPGFQSRWTLACELCYGLQHQNLGSAHWQVLVVVVVVFVVFVVVVVVLEKLNCADMRLFSVTTG